MLLFALTSASCFATDLAPWYPRIYELQPSVEVHTQHSRSIASDRGSYYEPLHANFINFSLEAAIFSWKNNFTWSGELELELADSNRRSFGLDNASATGRYRFTDDGEIDFFSSIGALTLRAVSKQALDDLNSFHHGKFESIAHLSVGKELELQNIWISNVWGAFGLGLADVGSPWMHLKLCVEKNGGENSILSLFVESLYGFGGNALSKHRKFHGYGPIAHRSIDLCGLYTYVFETGQKISIGGKYRVYARNFPAHTLSASLFFLTPFGL